MDKTIDCLLIGHNEMSFPEYEKKVREMGKNSGAYRDLNLSFLTYDNTPYHAAEIFNLFCYHTIEPGEGNNFLSLGRTFNAAISYLGTYLHNRGLTFDFVNSFQEEKDQLAKKLAKENILTIAIITTLYVSPLPIIEIMEFIKTYNQSAHIIIGGPFISTQVQSLGEDDLDILLKSTLGADFYVNSSQGENTLVNIIQALKKNLPLKQINSIYYKTSSGYTATPIWQENNQLSENMVNWDLFAPALEKGKYMNVNIRTSISCPFSCAFCGYPEHAGKFQTAELEALEEELNRLHQIKKVKYIHFIDDTFNVPAKRFKESLKMMIKNKYHLKWYSYFRAQYADKEMVEIMKESGCEGVYLGLESGNNQVLKNMNKSVTREEYLEGTALLKEYGIVTHGNFIMGFPGETHETVQDTIDLIEKSGIDFYRVQLWYCQMITPIYKQKEKYKIKGENFEWNHATMDSKTASNLVEKIFLSIENPIWVPQYNFNYHSIWHLIHMGMSMDQVKSFLKAFNRGIKEKLLNPSAREMSYEVITQIKKSCGCESDSKIHDFVAKEKSILQTSTAEFDFE